MSCSSDHDLVTHVDWVDETPDIFINFVDEKDRPGRLHCYNREALKQWLNMPENTFAEWVAKPGFQMESTGHYGAPNLSGAKYVKMYTGEFVVGPYILDILAERVNFQILYPITLDATYIGTLRIGNLRGTFGIGELHGQSPGYRVYRLGCSDKPPEKFSNSMQRDEKLKILEKRMREDFMFRSFSSLSLHAKRYTKLATYDEVMDYMERYIVEYAKHDTPDQLDVYVSGILWTNLVCEDIKIRIFIEWSIAAISNVIDKPKSQRKQNILELKRKLKDIPKLGIERKNLVIEAFARSAKQGFPTFADVKEIYELWRDKVVTEDELRGVFFSILYRARIIRNSSFYNWVKNTPSWGYRSDRKIYEQILEKRSIPKNTYEEMYHYHINKPSAKLFLRSHEI